MEKRQRILYLDVIRAAAICCVLMTHVSGYLIIMFEGKGIFSGYEYRIANLFNGISRAGVPLFIMLSGALILNEDKHFDTSVFYRKSLVPMAL